MRLRSAFVLACVLGCGARSAIEYGAPYGAASASDAAPADDATLGAETGAPQDAGHEGAAHDASALPDGASDAAHDGSAHDAGHDAGPIRDGGSDAGDGSTAWSPLVLGKRLALWLDPTTLEGDGGSVVRWRDRSGNSNDAYQTNSAYRPVFTASGLAGLPSATFNGPITFLDITDNPTMQWGTSDLLVLVVVGANSQTASTAMLYQKTGPYPTYDGVNLYLRPSGSSLACAQVQAYVLVESATPPASVVDSTVHLIGELRTGSKLEVRVDGVESNSLTSSTIGSTDVSAVGVPGCIGANGTPSPEFQQVHGDISEIVAVVGGVSTTELATLERSMMRRYGIP